jgi:hypothetical protein
VAKARGSFVLTLSRSFQDRCAADGAANNGRRPLALRHLSMPTNQKPTVQISQAFKVGFPIRRSMDQSLFAAPHGLSQRITSFIACACQGIHQMPLYHLIVLIAYAHPYWIWNSYPLNFRSKGFQIDLPATSQYAEPVIQTLIPFTSGPIRCHKRVRCDPLRWHAGAQQGHIFKTSFSR